MSKTTTAIIFFLSLLIATPLYSADRALLIGIDSYQVAKPPLQGAENDVKLVNNFIRDQLHFRPDQIKILLNQQATYANIINAFNSWLVAETGINDRVFFYYSGHGYFQPDTNGDEEDHLDETLVSYDTQQQEDQSFINMVTDDELSQVLEQLSNRNVVVMIDSCHSGTMSRDIEIGSSEQLAKTPLFSAGDRGKGAPRFRSTRKEESFVKATPNRIVWTAVSAAQTAFENNEIIPRNGVFTHAFLNGLSRGLADRNGNQVISHSELLDYVQAESTAFCKRHSESCLLGLTPSLEAAPEVLAQPVFAAFGYARESSAATQSEPQATDILAHGNDAGISFEMLPANRVQLGQEIQFRIKSPVDGYLVVLDINANNEVTQIFPNKFSDKAGKGNRIFANRPELIPNSYYGFSLPAGEPVGQGVLLAIVTEDHVPLDDLLDLQKGLQFIENSTGYLVSLAARLRQTWREDRFNRSLRWSLAEQQYTIF
jgi:hypothetical protein